MSQEISVQFTHSIKIEDTAKGIRISIHVYTNDRQTAINEVIETYLETKQKYQ
jgi:DNA gyrase/topoisomerase IV subunit B